MTLVAPDSVAEAVRLLAEDGARCLAGGQSLVAMMNADLVAPSTLVSLRRIPALAEIVTKPDGTLVLGAMATHNRVAAIGPKSAGVELIAAAAASIGHPAIRNQGTIGGSIAHADPAADYPTALTGAGATVVVAGAGGERRVVVDEFFLGFYETALRPGEMVVAVEVPPGPAGARAHYEKFTLIDGDFAVASVAAIVAMEGARCAAIRIAVGGCAPTPVRVAEAEARLIGSALDDPILYAASDLLVAACDPVDDFRGTATYRLKLVPRLVRRAVLAAAEKARGNG